MLAIASEVLTRQAARLLLALGFALLASVPGARAQSGGADRPQLLPTRDVDVTYRMIQHGQSLPQRMRWTAAARKLRVDPPMPDLFVIVDYDRRRLSMVRDKERTVIDMAAPAQFLSGIQSRLTDVVRQGEDRVAGLACTEWETKDLNNNPANVCITPDGVLLQVRSRGNVVLTAASVRYGPQDPALFRVPDGYIHLSPDSLPRLRPP